MFLISVVGNIFSHFLNGALSFLSKDIAIGAVLLFILSRVFREVSVLAVFALLLGGVLLVTYREFTK
ncbi:MAG TPA: hypothetical protein VLF68_03620 [Candidatus Saccharimonadales bacterium]|nr:hypothetical protein [Candidatus Saccharimonadales bacterium]